MTTPTPTPDRCPSPSPLRPALFPPRPRPAPSPLPLRLRPLPPKPRPLPPHPYPAAARAPGPLPSAFAYGDAWLYKPDLRALREKLRLPVGSFKLAVPLEAKARLYSVDRRREAYATILHSASEYVYGAIKAAQSIRQTGSTRDLVILVDETISDHHRKGQKSQ